MKMLLRIIRRRKLAYELLAEHDREAMEYLTTDRGTLLDWISRFAAHHNSRTRAESDRAVSEWRKAIERAMENYPQ